MSILTCFLPYAMFSGKPTVLPPKFNRVDADTKLVQYHDPKTGPKPPPKATNYLPLRTNINAGILTDMYAGQMHAHYEEIDSIPAASVSKKKSEFEAGHWYIVHPVSPVEMLSFSVRVLQDLERWIEKDCPDDLFTKRALQVFGFKRVRGETLESVKRELRKRKAKGEIGEEEGYTGSWEWVGGEEEEADGGTETETEGEGEGKGTGKVELRYTGEALAAAEQAGRDAAEEARIWDEYEFA